MTWGEVLAVFLRAAFLSVNGSTTLALLEQDLVQRLGVLSEAQYARGVAIGAISPGPFGYGCIALGYLADGWRGALVATVTSWLPAFLAIGLRGIYLRLETRAWVHGLRWGMAATGGGLMAALSWTLGLGAVTDLRTLTLAAVLLVLLARRLPAAAVLALAAVAGALLLR